MICNNDNIDNNDYNDDDQECEYLSDQIVMLIYRREAIYASN